MGSENQKLTAQQALTILNLQPGAGLEAVRRAFRGRVMSDHPDRPGGDAERFGQALEAYRLLQAQLSPPGVLAAKSPVAAPPAPPIIHITPLEAFKGGERLLPRADGKDPVALPPGLRHGDRLRIGADLLEVRIRNRSDLTIEGDDVHITVCAPAALLDQGGRLEVQTPAGPRQIYVPSQSDGVVRVHGLGLPATRRRPCGQLIVTLQVTQIAQTPACQDPILPQTSAQEKRKRFAEAWAA